jgi:ribosome-binding factor A
MANRIPQVNQLLKKELSKIILKEVDFPRDVLVTLTRVESFPNLQEARVFVSVLPERDSGKILDILTRRIYYLQQLLNKRLRMRPIPRINFLLEEETAEAGKIEEILERLKKQGK